MGSMAGDVMKSAFRRREETLSTGLTKDESCSSRFVQSSWKACRLRRRPILGVDVVCSIVYVATEGRRMSVMKRRNSDAEGCEQMQVDEGGKIDLGFLYIRKWLAKWRRWYDRRRRLFLFFEGRVCT